MATGDSVLTDFVGNAILGSSGNVRLKKTATTCGCCEGCNCAHSGTDECGECGANLTPEIMSVTFNDIACINTCRAICDGSPCTHCGSCTPSELGVSFSGIQKCGHTGGTFGPDECNFCAGTDRYRVTSLAVAGFWSLPQTVGDPCVYESAVQNNLITYETRDDEADECENCQGSGQGCPPKEIVVTFANVGRCENGACHGCSGPTDSYRVDTISVNSAFTCTQTVGDPCVWESTPQSALLQYRTFTDGLCLVGSTTHTPNFFVRVTRTTNSEYRIQGLGDDGSIVFDGSYSGDCDADKSGVANTASCPSCDPEFVIGDGGTCDVDIDQPTVHTPGVFARATRTATGYDVELVTTDGSKIYKRSSTQDCCVGGSTTGNDYTASCPDCTNDEFVLGTGGNSTITIRGTSSVKITTLNIDSVAVRNDPVSSPCVWTLEDDTLEDAVEWETYNSFNCTGTATKNSADATVTITHGASGVTAVLKLDGTTVFTGTVSPSACCDNMVIANTLNCADCPTGDIEDLIGGGTVTLGSCLPCVDCSLCVGCDEGTYSPPCVGRTDCCTPRRILATISGVSTNECYACDVPSGGDGGVRCATFPDINGAYVLKQTSSCTWEYIKDVGPCDLGNADSSFGESCPDNCGQDFCDDECEARAVLVIQLSRTSSGWSYTIRLRCRATVVDTTPPISDPCFLICGYLMQFTGSDCPDPPFFGAVTSTHNDLCDPPASISHGSSPHNGLVCQCSTFQDVFMNVSGSTTFEACP